MSKEDGVIDSRIALFMPTLEVGGAERVMITLANELSKKYKNVDLVVSSAVGELEAEVNPRVSIVNLNSKRMISSLLPLAAYLRNTRPDAMLSALNYANIVAIFARLLSGSRTRLVVSEHSNTRLYFKGSGAKKKVIEKLMWFYRLSDCIIAVSNGVRASLATTIAVPPDRITRIYNPIYKSEQMNGLYAGQSESATLRAMRILTVCRLTRAKDLPTLLYAFRHIASQRDAELTIVGDGEERQKLLEICEKLDLMDRVVFKGYSADPWMEDVKADVFVLSSAWEGFGNVLVEAMSHGLPVVSTDCPSGPREILEDGKWGRLTPVGDSRALASAILKTFDDKSHPDVVSRAQDFSVGIALEQYERALFDN